MTGLTGHLQRSFDAHYRLYEVLNKRRDPPTEDEMAIACGKKSLEPDVAKQYVEKLEDINNNIRVMFEKQAALGQV